MRGVSGSERHPVEGLLYAHDYCVFDLETTGFSPEQGARIIEVGAVRLREAEVVADFHTLVDPEEPIPEAIRELTGITDEDVAGAPTVTGVLEEFSRFSEDTVLVAHNAPFDLSFLNRYHPDPPDPTCVDTLPLARRLLNLESYALEALLDHFEIERPRAHRGLEDARATARLFRRLTDRAEDPREILGHGVPPELLGVSPDAVREGAEDPTRAILRATAELSTAVGVNKLAAILAGSSRQDLERYRDLESFGRLSGRTQTDLRELIEGCVEEALLERSEGRYPTLALTREGAGRLTGS